LPDQNPTPRRRRWIFLTVGAAAVVVLVVAVIGITRYFSSPVDMHGNHVQADTVAPPVASSSAVPVVGDGRFIAPSVGLNVPLGALNAVGGVIEPPGFTSAYWIRNEGVSLQDAAKGTVFVVMHSLRNGGVGPGNYLIDVQRQTARIALGATIEVDGVTYRVTGTSAIRKPDIAYASAIWTNTPDRLVVITCLQRPQGGPSLQNMVIEARRVENR